jgi:hypothetical protein
VNTKSESSVPLFPLERTVRRSVKQSWSAITVARKDVASLAAGTIVSNWWKPQQRTSATTLLLYLAKIFMLVFYIDFGNI